MPLAIDKLSYPVVRQRFSERIADRLLDQSHLDSAAAADQWQALKDTVCTVANDILGPRCRKQPDWFHASHSTLQPLIDAKNMAHAEHLQKGTASARKHFRQTQRTVAQAVRCAKEAWIEEVATQAEQASHDSSARWNAIR